MRRITEAATAKRPLVIEFEQGPSAYALYDPVIEDAQFFNIQVMSKQAVNLNAKLEWGYPSAHDFDLFVYGAHGERVADSQNLGPSPAADPWNENAGAGYELITGLGTPRCTGYTIESKGFLSPGTPLRLTVWLD